eukprot:1924175-Prymnesium_polylepis.2
MVVGPDYRDLQPWAVEIVRKAVVVAVAACGARELVELDDIVLRTAQALCRGSICGGPASTRATTSCVDQAAAQVAPRLSARRGL